MIFFNHLLYPTYGIRSAGIIVKFVNIRYKGIEVYDGNFVIMFTGVADVDGIPVGDKYRTESLDRKYEENAPKINVIDVYTIDRNMKKSENNEKK